MLACSHSSRPSSLATSSGRRRRHPSAVSAARNDDGQLASSETKPVKRRLSRILQQYDEAELEKQQEALRELEEERMREREQGRTVASDSRASGARRKARGSRYLEARQQDTRSLVFRYDPETKQEVAVRGGLGRGQPCWWALWVKSNREKQVAEGLEQYVEELPPVVNAETGEMQERVLRAWAPAKKVKAWNPKTGKMGYKTFRFEDGGVVFVNAILDDHLELALQKNVNVMGYQVTEGFMTSDGQLQSFPRPESAERIRAAKEWEEDLAPIEEEAMRQLLGMPTIEQAAVLEEAAREEEEREAQRSRKRDERIKGREWYDGSTASSARDQEWAGGWDSQGSDSLGEPVGELRSTNSGGEGPLAAGLRARVDVSEEEEEDRKRRRRPSMKQIEYLEILGYDGRIPASMADANQLITELKAKNAADSLRGPPGEEQVQYLKDLGFQGDQPATRAAAALVIDELEAQFEAEGRQLPERAAAGGGKGAGDRERGTGLDPAGPPSQGQMDLLARLGSEAPPPATRAEASALIDRLREAEVERGGEGGGRREKGAGLDPLGPASEGQLDLLAKLQYEGDPPATRCEADRLIDDIKAARKQRSAEMLDPAGPPSQGQMDLLGKLDYQGDPPASRGEADRLIDDIKAARKQEGVAFLDPTAPPSSGQLDLLDKLDYEGEPPATRQEASRLIDEIKASRPHLRRGEGDDHRNAPPTEGQLRYLDILRYEGAPPATRAEAHDLIDRIKGESAAQGLGSFATPPPNPQGPVSEGQRRLLSLLGYEGGDPATRAEADALIDSLKAEQGGRGATAPGGDPNGPASLGQLRYLALLGHEPQEAMTRGEAGVLIDQLKKERIQGPDPEGPPSEGQIRLLRALGLRGPGPTTRAEADEEIDRLKAERGAGKGRRRREEEREEFGDPSETPPSEGQLRFLANLGHAGEAPASRAEASALIDALRGDFSLQPPSEGQLRFLGLLGHEGAAPASRAEADGLIDSLKRRERALSEGGEARAPPDPHGPPSEGQRRFLEQLGYAGEPPATRAEADEAIQKLRREAGADAGPSPFSPPSEGQLRFLAALGYSPDAPPPATRAEADTLINGLKAQQGEAGGRRPWPPSEGQLNFLANLGYQGPPPATKAEAGELISQLKGTPPSPTAPPSQGQLRYLEQLGYSGQAPGTRGEAGELIDSLKADKWTSRGSTAWQGGASGSNGGWYTGGSGGGQEGTDALSFFGIEPAQDGPDASVYSSDFDFGWANDSWQGWDSGRGASPARAGGREREGRGRREGEERVENRDAGAETGWYGGGGDAVGADADLDWWDAEGDSAGSSTVRGTGGDLRSHPLSDLRMEDGDVSWDESWDAASSAPAGTRGDGRGGRRTEGPEGGDQGSGAAALQPGATVEVVSGAFAEFQGQVVAVEGQRVKAELDIFGRRTEVDLDPKDVRRLQE